MNQLTQEYRLERARLSLEWLEAYAAAERMVRWGLATGKITLDQVPAIREELRAIAPFDVYVRGRWQPPAREATDADTTAALIAEISAWEAQEGIQP